MTDVNHWANQIVASAEPAAEADLAARRMIIGLARDIASILIEYSWKHGSRPVATTRELRHLNCELRHLNWVMMSHTGRSHAEMVYLLTWVQDCLWSMRAHLEEGDRSSPAWEAELNVFEPLRLRFESAIAQCRLAGWKEV